MISVMIAAANKTNLIFDELADRGFKVKLIDQVLVFYRGLYIMCNACGPWPPVQKLRVLILENENPDLGKRPKADPSGD